MSEAAQHAPPWRPDDTFATRLIMLRHQFGITQDVAARVCGLDDGSWSNWEKGTRPRDKVEIVAKIVHGLLAHFGVYIDGDWLLKGGPLNPPSTKWLPAVDEPAGQRPFYLLGQPRLPGLL